MCDLHFAWLELAVAVPLVGALLVVRLRDPEVACRRSLVIIGVVLLLTIGAWLDYWVSGCATAQDAGFLAAMFGSGTFGIDALNAPLIPLTALLFFVITLATLRTKVRRFRFAWSLLSLSVTIALFSCRSPWAIIGLSLAQLAQPWAELHARGRSTRVLTLYMTLFAVGLVGGWAMLEAADGKVRVLGIGLVAAAILIRTGAAPLHCWMTDLFENAGFGMSLLFATPMTGALLAVRLLLPIASDGTLRAITIISLSTAVYASGMALVQRNTRRFFCYLFLSNLSLILVGLTLASATSLTGGLALWLSAAIALTGLGLTLRAVESRCGRLSLADYHGLYQHMPALAKFYLLTALASIGFPATIGFVSAELLVEGAVHAAPLVGMIVVLTGALNGIAVMRVYFRLFTGTHHTSSVPLEARLQEKLAVLTMTLLILGGGLLPQPGTTSRYRAAEQLLAQRQEARPPALKSPRRLARNRAAQAAIARIPILERPNVHAQE